MATKKKLRTRKPSSRRKAEYEEPAGTAPTLARGPRKELSKTVLQPQHTTHKLRAGWFQARASWPFREPDIENLLTERARTQPAQPAPPAASQWEAIGPTNIGGRCTSLVCHPTNPDILWIGAAGGGVWKSTDGGGTWSTVWHSQESLNIGALAIDPSNPDVLYCGTGEANLSADSYAGVGVYRTQDGGDTWVLWAPAARLKLPVRIGTIAVDPFDPMHVRIGGVRHSRVDFSGMFATRDAGATWKMETFVTTAPYFCHSIVFHPTKQGGIFATVDEQGERSGIWRSTDRGATWTHLTSGLPPSPQMGRTSLAIASSKPEFMYAITANGDDGVLGVFLTQNGGNTWKSIGGNEFSRERQMSYGNTIVVHPTNHRTVLCGGVDLHRTTDAGATWTQVTKWNVRRGTSRYAHADHHALAMPAAAPGRVYDANDGGMDRSTDGGTTWQNMSNGLEVTMYYDLDVAPTDAKSFGGGAQDNGTLVTTTGGANDHFELLGGDGGWMVYSSQSESRVYASFQHFRIFRFRGQEVLEITPSAATDADHQIWMCYITPDLTNANTVFTGSRRVWRTLNDGDSWQAVSRDLDGSFITAIEVAPADRKRVYVGTENGGIFRSTDGGATWSANIATSRLPGRTITRLETHPTNAKHVITCVAGVRNSHVFASVDGGAVWTDIDQGKLPDVPHHAIVIPPDDPGSIYVGNDAGVYSSADGGATWTNLSRNLPNTMVVDMVYHTGQAALYAATYGRSIWRMRLR